MFIYDVEILNAIAPPEGVDKSKDLTYCDGWRDFAGMGISCIGALEIFTGRPHLFLADNLGKFQALIDAAPEEFPPVAFNGYGFDNQLLRACGFNIHDSRTVDLMLLCWQSMGLSDVYNPETHKGAGLDAIIKANFPGLGKTGTGSAAPELWQYGFPGKVVNYCLDDCWLERALFLQLAEHGTFINPLTGAQCNINLADGARAFNFYRRFKEQIATCGLDRAARAIVQ